MSAKERIAVQLGNATARASIRIVRAFKNMGMPVILENPINSQLFYVLESLTKADDCEMVTTDQCQFGTRWRKRTRLCCWNVPNSAQLGRLCHGRKGQCSLSGKHHIVLTGPSPCGIPWTRLAQEYPRKLCTALAHKLTLAADEQSLAHVRSLMANAR